MKSEIRKRRIGAPAVRISIFDLLSGFGFRPSAFALGSLCLFITLTAAAAPGMAIIPAASYRPFFRSDSEAKEVSVKAFALDIHPVTNADFLDFVRANPRWRRSQVKRLFADQNYLEHWA